MISPPENPRKRSKGFTLAELLICLVILAEIATFTIPKILVAQQNQRNNAIAKEAVAMISGALQVASLNGAVTSSTSAASLTPYLNYVSLATTGTIDSHPNYVGTAGGGLDTCDASNPCLLLHNGSKLKLSNGTFAGGTYINFVLDPDLVSTGGTADGPSKSVQFHMTQNGRTMTRGVVPGIENSSFDPSWFSW